MNDIAASRSEFSASPQHPHRVRLGASGSGHFGLVCAGLVLAAMTCCGCADMGRDFNMSLADQVVPGKTTSRQVEELLGQPSAIVNGAGGTKTYQYYYTPFNLMTERTLDTYSKRLHVEIDDKGVVSGVTKMTMPVTVSK